jgi:hypothetical protein
MLAYDPGRSLPWIGLLADAIRSVWEKPEVKKAERLTTLSLDEPLQNAAQQFVSQKGRKLHGELLSGRQGPSTSASRCLVHLGCREWRDACACRMAAHDF